MFFELHEENKIGYKELGDADLGRAEKSNQTHIGLFDDVLTFLPNSSIIKDAIIAIELKYCRCISIEFKIPMVPTEAPKYVRGRAKAKVY